MDGDFHPRPGLGLRDSYATSGASTPNLVAAPLLGGSTVQLTDKEYFPEVDEQPPRTAKPRSCFRRAPFIVGAAVVVAIIAGVVLGVLFGIVKKRDDDSSNASTKGNASSGTGNGKGNQTGTASDPTTPIATFATGGDGSTVTTEDGTKFTYRNPFGGYWVSDSANPFDNSARPNSWTPPLNQSWKWDETPIYGVNLGGLFVLEPFIVPSLFEQNPGAVDEWTLSELLAQKGPDVLQQTLENHYNTFITEEDIAQIAGAGLNWIRLPIPYWAVETWQDAGVDEAGQRVAEPFLARVCWKYILRVIGWARKYGIRINLDLHTAPGSQSAFNHSGKRGRTNWLLGVMGLANAERTLDYIRVITQFISQPEYKDVVPMFSILNEPLGFQIGQKPMEAFYYRAYEMIRGITGIGEGKGPMIALHDAFGSSTTWADFLRGADRLVLDTHPYFAFTPRPQPRDPLNITATGDPTQMGGPWPLRACDQWGANSNRSRSRFGPYIAGEFSNAINDCNLFMREVDVPVGRDYGAGCDYWDDYEGWSDDTKAGMRNMALATMDALQQWFFWTWKIGESTTTNKVRAPFWSYKLGLQEGWMPKDPRESVGKCASLGSESVPFDGHYESWMTGGVGAGTIAPSATVGLEWPPAVANTILGNEPTVVLPQYQYTSTGTVITLPPPTFAPSVTASAGNGWFNAQDNAPMVTPIAGCTYQDAWDTNNAEVPPSECRLAQ